MEGEVRKYFQSAFSNRKEIECNHVSIQMIQVSREIMFCRLHQLQSYFGNQMNTIVVSQPV